MQTPSIQFQPRRYSAGTIVVPASIPVKGIFTRMKEFAAERKIGALTLFLFFVYVVAIIKFITLDNIENSIFFGVYSILVSFYILSRFLLAYFYEPAVHARLDYFPSVTFVTPAKDEEENIAKTLRAMLKSDYPKELVEIVAVNDGSSDRTYEEMVMVQKEAEKAGIAMTVVDWKKNRGKREGMAEGVRRASGDIIVFIDSDSFVEPSTVRELAKYFADPEIGAVAGHADVYNKEDNFLTRMQAVRYFVAFKAYKSAEALFGAVTCCSGCCSAYRRTYVREILDSWLEQTFMGVRCTYGDDRSLTNMLMKRGYKTIYSPDALSYTVVPNTWGKFLKQQLRWKKSWTRESLEASFFMWKKHPIMSLSFFTGVFLPLVAPLIVFRALFWVPAHMGVLPYMYVGGLVLMSLVYGTYYRIYRTDNLWLYGMFFAWIYSLILIWQLPYAILTLRDSRWGTR